MSQQVELRASQIVKNTTNLTLRDVDVKSTQYEKLKKSIGEPKYKEITKPDGSVEKVKVAEHGLLNPISVRPVPGEPGKYALIDGGHRHAAWQELFGDSLPIPALVKDYNEVQTMEAQIEGNFHVKKTRPAEYTRQIKRLLTMYPNRSIEEQASRLHMDSATLRQWFGLLKLKGTKFETRPDPDNPGETIEVSAIQLAVDTGELPLSAAFVISTAGDADENHDAFWAAKQDEFFAAALQAKSTPQGTAKFCMDATQTIKDIKKKFREQKDPNSVEFATPPVMRKLGELKIELTRQREANEADGGNEELVKQVTELKQSYPEAVSAIRRAGYLGGIEYCLQQDPETLAARKKKHDEDAAARKEAQEEKKAGPKAAALARSAGMFGRRI